MGRRFFSASARSVSSGLPRCAVAWGLLSRGGGGGWGEGGGRRGRLGGHSVDKEGMSPHRWGCSLAGLARRVKYREFFLLFLRVKKKTCGFCRHFCGPKKARSMGLSDVVDSWLLNSRQVASLLDDRPSRPGGEAPPNPIGNGWLEIALAVRNPAVRFPLCVSSCRPAGEFTISHCSISGVSALPTMSLHTWAPHVVFGR